MDNTFVCKSMFTWYKEMLNLDQQVTDETIIIAAEAICEKMGQPVSEITQEWVSKFKDRYGIRTEDSSSRPQMSALWRAKRRRKISQPEPSQELMDKRARLGKSYAIDEDSDLEKEGGGGGNEQQQQQNEDKDGSDTDSLCGFSFEELNSVPEYKPHQCPHCTERYLWGHQLREHMKCHSDVKTYLCTICGKSYKSPHNLKIHMRVHTGDRPYVCTTCDKGFREQSALVKHTRIHTGERPFLCSDCGSAFISKTQLNIHVKTHHSDGQTEKRKNSKSTSSHTTTTPVSTSLTEDDRSSYSGSKTKADSTNTSSQAFSGSNMEQPSLGQLLPGTGFYVASTTAGSISCGTPIVSANQYSNKVPNMGTNPQQRQQEIGQVDQTQVQMAQDFINSAAAQAYLYQDYYYNT